MGVVVREYPHSVELTAGEIAIAQFVGSQRDVAARVYGRKDTKGYTESRIPRFEQQIQSAAAELAVAKALNQYWSGALTWEPNLGGLADVGGLVEVRSTATNPPHLIIHPREPDDRPFFLVTGSIPTFTIHGWAMGCDAKKDKWWDKTRPFPAYFLPASELRKTV